MDIWTLQYCLKLPDIVSSGTIVEIHNRRRNIYLGIITQGGPETMEFPSGGKGKNWREFLIVIDKSHKPLHESI